MDQEPKEKPDRISCECGHSESRVVNSRMYKSLYRVRRYQCKACGGRYSTIELKVDMTKRRAKRPASEALQAQILEGVDLMDLLIAIDRK